MLARLIPLNLIFVVVSGFNLQSPLPKEPKTVPSDTRITLSESGLLITITADGSVLVEGESGFEFDIARVKQRISARDLKELVGEFLQADYFLLNDRYQGKEDGCPVTAAECLVDGIVTSFTFNGGSKTIAQHKYACLTPDGLSYPPELIKLEKEIKDVVGLKRR